MLQNNLHALAVSVSAINSHDDGYDSYIGDKNQGNNRNEYWYQNVTISTFPERSGKINFGDIGLCWDKRHC